MIDKKLCVTVTRAKKIKVTEAKSRTAIILNPGETEFNVVRFDGCAVTNEIAADFVVTKQKFGDLVIELKGKDVKHAIEQITATASYLRANEVAEGRVGGVIVCKEYPKTTTTIQVLKMGLKKKFDCPIKVFTKDSPEIDFETSLGHADLLPNRKKAEA
ncbi:hypothetical protein [Burkholderia ambifaria]|uniref:hypothetical protein n=1 Tax=Burkholderia ambifaria TaxID=152480 RepID=UPI00158D1679|nr:hypothetical protein [Burkholderia ambifaria]